MAGIGGASLGTEILKCLNLADRYTVFGCDISRLAFGHYQSGCEETFLIDRENYTESVLAVCQKAAIEIIIPGGEEPLVLLNTARVRLGEAGVHLAANSEEVISRFSDKLTTFRVLSELGFEVPRTLTGSSIRDLDEMTFPCIVKPATGSGGSSFVFLAEDRDEALIYLNYLVKNGKRAIVQEYISAEE
ncbi:MAG TPA: ATP-grasp domain-containing protein, partial [Pyrinomonadaceae bacterium]|nr:ATP-grasp domain-containing protein [Pyrinomonadaceae bacterium]